MFSLILLISIAGIFGGLISYMRLPTKKFASTHDFVKSIILGVGASFLVPLFLSMIQSNLLKECSGSFNPNHLIFFSFCIIAAIFSNEIIRGMGQQVLRQLQETTADLETVKDQVKNNKKDVDLMVDWSSHPTNLASVEKSTILPTIIEELKVSDEIKLKLSKVLEAILSAKLGFKSIETIYEETGIPVAEVPPLAEILIQLGKVRRRDTPSGITYACNVKREEANQLISK